MAAIPAAPPPPLSASWHLVSGAVSGVASVLALQPLDRESAWPSLPELSRLTARPPCVQSSRRAYSKTTRLSQSHRRRERCRWRGCGQAEAARCWSPRREELQRSRERRSGRPQEPSYEQTGSLGSGGAQLRRCTGAPSWAATQGAGADHLHVVGTCRASRSTSSPCLAYEQRWVDPPTLWPKDPPGRRDRVGGRSSSRRRGI